MPFDLLTILAVFLLQVFIVLGVLWSCRKSKRRQPPPPFKDEMESWK